MIFIGILLCLAVMAGISYMAIDKKSTFPVRIACLIALAFMIIAVIICVIKISSGPVVQVDWSQYIVGEPVEVKKDDGNSIGIIITLVFMLILFAVITYLSLKEQRKHEPPKPKADDISAPTDDFEL
jgi:ABC-type Mn2+/Zn2+ transport system permease subunit